MPEEINKQEIKEQENNKPTDTDENVNRVRGIAESVVGNEDPDDLMVSLMDVLTEGSKVPEVGKFYIFIYNAKTSRLNYDQNPLVAVTEVFPWGFRGENFHWDGKVRQYTSNEIVGGLFEVYPSEIKDLQMIPFGKLRLNN